MTTDDPQKILIVYDYFFPGYKAGGPVQSLVNLVTALGNNYKCFIVTSGFDLHSAKSYDNVTLNQWNNVILPGSDQTVSVWYSSASRPTYNDIRSIIENISPGTVYLNGLFSFRFFVLPLIIVRPFKKIKVVVCPRGMLQQGALQGKSLKKRIYLNFIKLSGLITTVWWHATSTEEEKDIKVHFRSDQVYKAPNVPKKPWPDIMPSTKEPGRLRLVYLSLIAEKKNLHILLDVLKQTSDISLDIYGPVKDIGYWKKCEDIILGMPEIATYKGDVKPAGVQETLSEYDALALLTKGENFGHAIYESLSVGRPVVISNFTPWQNLTDSFAGWNSDFNMESIREILESLKTMDRRTHQQFCEGAHRLATSYYSNMNVNKSYDILFNNFGHRDDLL